MQQGPSQVRTVRHASSSSRPAGRYCVCCGWGWPADRCDQIQIRWLDRRRYHHIQIRSSIDPRMHACIPINCPSAGCWVLARPAGAARQAVAGRAYRRRVAPAGGGGISRATGARGQGATPLALTAGKACTCCGAVRLGVACLARPSPRIATSSLVVVVASMDKPLGSTSAAAAC
jgi:hypothetical protein